MIMFNTGPGRLVSLPDPAAAGAQRLVGLTGFPLPRVIITRVGVSAQASAQFLHSMGGQVFIYVFGDRVSSVRVSGLAFQAGCGGGGSQHGVESVMRWYNQHRVTARQREMEVMVGTSPIRGFLLGIDLDIVSPDTRIFSYVANLALVPEA
jgi:hypothetical protein